ncbi:hypothetical protein NQZ68_036527 [Dissostichus eleginoides]|nr:hypothetical protein NQZ68_036527 [Dissostichus eleginoides]
MAAQLAKTSCTGEDARQVAALQIIRCTWHQPQGLVGLLLAQEGSPVYFIIISSQLSKHRLASEEWVGSLNTEQSNLSFTAAWVQIHAGTEMFLPSSLASVHNLIPNFKTDQSKVSKTLCKALKRAYHGK